MARFIDLIENAGTMEDEKTGNEIKWRNFMFGYTDTVIEAEKGRNEVAGTKERYFQKKIKGDNISAFFGFEVFTADQFNGLFGKEIDLIYGRDGVVAARFKELPTFDADYNLIDDEITGKKKA